MCNLLAVLFDLGYKILMLILLEENNRLKVSGNRNYLVGFYKWIKRKEELKLKKQEKSKKVKMLCLQKNSRKTWV